MTFKRYFILTFLILILNVNCSNEPSKDTTNDSTAISVAESDISQKMNVKTDSVIVRRYAITKKPITSKDFFAKKFLDIDGEVSVINGKVSKFGINRIVYLTVKNNTIKEVSAIRFEWTCSDAFGHPANLGREYTEGYGTDYAEEINLKPGKAKHLSFPIKSNNASKVDYAMAIEIAYSDGSFWKRN